MKYYGVYYHLRNQKAKELIREYYIVSSRKKLESYLKNFNGIVIEKIFQANRNVIKKFERI